jgi:hypothetical protein
MEHAILGMAFLQAFFLQRRFETSPFSILRPASRDPLCFSPPSYHRLIVAFSLLLATVRPSFRSGSVDVSLASRMPRLGSFFFFPFPLGRFKPMCQKDKLVLSMWLWLGT